MTNLRSIPAVFALSLFAVVAGCGGQVEDAPRNAAVDAAASAGPDELVLRVERTSGFTLQRTVRELPVVSVYGDGRVISQGPQIEIYPSPALPNLQVRTISRADVGKLAGLAVNAGVGGGTDLGRPPVADAPSTRFTVRGDGGVRTTEVYALAEGDGLREGLTEAQVAARSRLDKLLAQLTDLSTTLGGGAGKEEPYVAKATAAVGSAYTADAAAEGLQQQAVGWPGPNLPGEPLAKTPDTGCVLLTGDAATAVLDAAKRANVATPWTSGGRQWSVVFRPLLPDQKTCADIAA